MSSRISAAEIETRAARNRAAWQPTTKTEPAPYVVPKIGIGTVKSMFDAITGGNGTVSRVFILPYPPSTNTYWRNIGAGRTILSAKARAYRKAVKALASLPKPLESRLIVTVELYPPDKRRRDLDNVTKALFDSLQHAGVYLDDSQIDEFSVRRMQVVKGGRCEVFIKEI